MGDQVLEKNRQGARAGLAPKEAALVGVIDEVTRGHFALGRLAEKIHHEGVSSSGRRALLRNLIELGPRTVPELARMRPVSRQFIQTLVDALVADGLVVLADNPAHKRSKLVRISAKGRRVYRDMRKRETPVAAWLGAGFSRAELEAGYDFLRRFRDRVDGFEGED